MYRKIFQTMFLVVGIWFLPADVSAAITINEVAWMGTTNSQYEEWIELYNNGSTQSLDGWKIYKAGGGTLLINLSGSISAGEYLLVCRTTPSVSNPLGGSCGVTGGFGGSGLNNTSEHIILKDGGGSTIDSINATSGWPAGNSTTKDTMQKSGSGWITALGTPGTANSSSDNGGGGTTPTEEEEEEEIEEVATGGTNDSVKVFPTMLLKIESPKIAIAGSPAHFKAEALDFDRTGMFKGRYVWNMGDGTVREMSAKLEYTKAGFDYNYEYPGIYSVNVKYYHSHFEEKVPPDVETQFTVEVIAPTITISKVYPDGAIEVKNTSENSIDISGWQLRDTTGNNFFIPDDTRLQANTTIVFSRKITKLNPVAGVHVFTPTNTLASSGVIQASTKTYSKTSGVSSATASTLVSDKTNGEVLGVENLDAPVSEETTQGKNTNQGLVWVLLFIILVLIAVIAVLFLRKVETTDDSGYELIDE